MCAGMCTKGHQAKVILRVGAVGEKMFREKERREVMLEDSIAILNLSPYVGANLDAVTFASVVRGPPQVTGLLLSRTVDQSQIAHACSHLFVQLLSPLLQLLLTRRRRKVVGMDRALSIR